MDQLPVHRMAVVRPWAEYLARLGVPVQRAFRQARLPFLALDDIDSYVPSSRFWKFVVDAAADSGIDDLGFRVGQISGANSADPRMARMLLEAPTLKLGLCRASELTNRMVTNCRVGLLPSRCGNFTYFYHSPSCSKWAEAVDQIGGFGLMTLLGMVRVYTDERWVPKIIGLMGSRLPSEFIRGKFPDTRFVLHEPVSYIVLPNSLLSIVPQQTSQMKGNRSVADVSTLEGNLPDALRRVLRAYLQEPYLSIRTVADLTDTSPRSLQRGLAACGTTYSQLLDEVRIEYATRLLRDPGIAIGDIARELGYRHPTHFSRAFKRIAGVSPREYRRQNGPGHTVH